MTDRTELAKAALLEITPAATVGDFVSEEVSEDGVYTLLFEATMTGYPGWHWTVSVAALDGEEPTVLEAELLPGDGALLAPDWVPWSDRLEEYNASQVAEGDAEEAEDSDDDDSDDDDDESDDDDSDDDDDDSDDDESDDDESDDDDDDDDDDGDHDLGEDLYDGVDIDEAALADPDEDADADR